MSRVPKPVVGDEEYIISLDPITFILIQTAFSLLLCKVDMSCLPKQGYRVTKGREHDLAFFCDPGTQFNVKLIVSMHEILLTSLWGLSLYLKFDIT